MWKERLTYRKNLARSRVILRFAKFGFLGAIGIFLFLFIILPIISLTLPSPDKIVRTQGFSTEIQDRNGNVLYDVYANQNRTPVQLNDIPLYLRQATIAIEDKT